MTTRVLIAGGGVAGVEAMLALHHLAPERVEVDLLTPSQRFVYRPLQVVEPFGSGEEGVSMDLERIVADSGARHIEDALASVDPAERVVTASSGETHEYDALLVALGARPAEAVPGALTFGGDGQRRRFDELLASLGHRGSKRIAFVVPASATWSIAAYELALLTAAERDARRLDGVEIILVTYEWDALEVFGSAASELVARRLADAGVELLPASVARGFEGGRLAIAGSDPLEVDHAVSLPALEVPPIPGLPQGEGGFVRTDAQMRVDGLEDVWAAGDVTPFPIKQGGIAAQQSDVAATGIARRAGAGVRVEPFAPVLRGTLITGEAPDYIRADPDGPDGGAAGAGVALWAPRGKIAGRFLAPYLAGEAGELGDVEPADPGAERAAHTRAVELILSAADADAALERFDDALRWLSLVEELNLVIPPEYVARRYDWRHRLDPATEPDPAARRIDPSFASVADAISDLQRRIGWLREIERRHEGEMRAQLAAADAGLSELKALSNRTGALSPLAAAAASGEGDRGRE
jgi:sulfide:quinone oxidoreductase